MKRNLLLIFTILSALIISACADDINNSGGDTVIPVIPVIPEKPVEVWDGTTTVEPLTSSEGAYLIANGSNLAWLNDKTLDKNMILTNDINMNNQIFTGIDNITGDITIDGDNHTILNLKLVDTVSDYDGVALIQEVGDGAKLTIKNLNLKDGTVNSAIDDKMFGASFVADVFSGDVTLSNVSSDLTVYATTYAGGFIGKIAGASKSIIIEKSMNKDNVSCGTSHAGGLIGIADSSDVSFTITIDNSSNEGNVVSGTSDYYAAGGGLIGNIQKVNTVNIINSYNKGSVTSNSNNNVAGLIGYVETSADLVNIDKSYNNGVIKSLGGAAGLVAGNNNTVKTTITNSFNSGDVEGTFGIGGLLGGTSGPDIKASYNSGKITTKAPNPAYDNSFAGGLIGSVWNSDASIVDSYNIGVIASYSGAKNSYSGGLIGKASTLYGLQLNMTITSSYSYTDMIAVTASGSTPVTTPILGIKEEGDGKPITITATDNFYYSVTPLTNSDHASVKTDVEFKDQATFTSWDFVNTWEIVEGAKYPTLKNVVKLKK